MTAAFPDRRGYFGQFGGRYVPETVMGALDELERGYKKIRWIGSFKRNCNFI